jgi:hypothetical protein
LCGQAENKAFFPPQHDEIKKDNHSQEKCAGMSISLAGFFCLIFIKSWTGAAQYIPSIWTSQRQPHCPSIG